MHIRLDYKSASVTNPVIMHNDILACAYIDATHKK